MTFLGRRTRVFNLGVGLLVNMLTGPFGIKLYRHGILNGIGEGDSTYEKAVKSHGGINFWVDSDAYNIVECIHMIWATTAIDAILGRSVYEVS